MQFLVYQYQKDRDCFIVTDPEHEQETLRQASARGPLEKVGKFAEMGSRRAAFDETLAKNSIREQGFYLFTAKSFAPAGEPPLAMP